MGERFNCKPSRDTWFAQPAIAFRQVSANQAKRSHFQQQGTIQPRLCLTLHVAGRDFLPREALRGFLKGALIICQRACHGVTTSDICGNRVCAFR